MGTKITHVISVMVFATGLLLNINSKAQQLYRYGEKDGCRILQKSTNSITIDYSVAQMTAENRLIDGNIQQNISLSGVFLPNEAGSPDLPSSLQYIAIPQGSTASLKIISTDTEIIEDMDIAPAPVIPLDRIETIGEPLVYKMNDAIYSANAMYPSQPVQLSATMQIRGIDVVSLGICPFQYNPVTKKLMVYKNIRIEISFEGENQRFGADSYRSRWWDPILEDVILNYDQLAPVDYNARIQTALEEQRLTFADAGCEYAIIVPDGPDFSIWADSIRRFRTEQGIYTKIYKISDIGGNTVAAIKNWVTDAYKNWTIKPAAMLILADYGTNAASTIISTKSPGFACDNYYADVTGDDLPDIAFSRIVANNAAQLKVMCTKFLDYERNPPRDAAFYDKPLSATGWQDDRWYQLGVEVTGGFMKSINKHPVRVNSPSSPASNTGNDVAGSGNWSTTNAATIVSYFGDSGLKYIPNKPGTLGKFTGGTATQISAAINNGAFIAFHRDHGSYTGWYKPSYKNPNLTALTNVNNRLPFVFSVNCNTGEYQTGAECFAESFHRYTYNGKNSGALGVIAPSEVSYSFVNDVYLWGMFDNMWPNFMPSMGTSPASRDMRPTFASVAGKYFLSKSSWVGSQSKVITYQLFHAFSESFQWFYSEVPKELTVIHSNVYSSSTNSYTVQADAGSFIALTTSTPAGPVILGTATGTGSPVQIALSGPISSKLLVTVTKQDYLRYGKIVDLTTSIDNQSAAEEGFVCFPNPFNQVTTFSYELIEAGMVNLTLYSTLGEEVAKIVNEAQASGKHEIQFNNKNLASGVYMGKLITPSGIRTMQVVIKE